MNLPKIVVFLIAAFLVYTFLTPWIGVSGFLASVLITVGILAAAKTFLGQNWAFPWSIRGLYVVVILFLGVLFGGVFSFASLGNLSASMVSGEQIVQPIGEVTVPVTDIAACSVSNELKGKESTLHINAWDMESNTPYSSAVDLTTGCWLFKDGNDAKNFVAASSDTSDYDLTAGFAVGDQLYMYCGGTSYYTDPVEGLCINSQDTVVNLETHNAVAETDMQITGYDDSGGTTLSSGTTSEEDYYITQGAGAEDSLYLKLKQNSANQAYDFCAWGTMALYNLSSLEPVAGQGFSEDVTPTWAKSVAVGVDEYASGTTTYTDSYSIFKLAKAQRLHEWESIKTEFTAKTTATGDPEATGDNSTTPCKYIALAIDCQYSRGLDGAMHYDIHDHTDSEGDVGVAETETSPLGATVGVVIEAR